MAVVALAIVALACLAGLLWREHQHQKDTRTLQEDWALERRELLNRIQHPQMMPVPRIEPAAPLEPSRDEMMLAQLGQIIPGHLMEQWDDNGDGN